MEDKRGFRRFDTTLNVQYFLKKKKEGWKKCVATDICHKGVGIKFNTGEGIDIGSAITLEIFIPTALEPLDARGVVKRIAKDGDDFIGGIEFDEVMDSTTWNKICWGVLEI